MPSKKRRMTKAEKATLETERALYAPHRKSAKEVKEGLFRIEAVSAASAEYENLGAKHACPDLALALCGAHMMGPIPAGMHTPLFLKTDEKYPWAGIVQWLDTNVDQFNVRFERTAELKEEEDHPMFGLIKLKGDKECSLYWVDEVYPKEQRGAASADNSKRKGEGESTPAPLNGTKTTETSQPLGAPTGMAPMDTK